jgi:hypothetical protein
MTRISKNLYEKRAIRKQDTKDDTFDPFEDKHQSTPNHFNFQIAKYTKQPFSKFLSFFLFFYFIFIFITIQQPLNTLPFFLFFVFLIQIQSQAATIIAISEKKRKN